MNISVRKKSGRAFNGAQRDAGFISHAVPCNDDPSWSKALCGTVPGIRGNGWTTPSSKPLLIGGVTCEKCKAKLSATNQER